MKPLAPLSLILAAVAALANPLAHAQAVRTERNMSLDLAKQIAAATVASCSARGFNVAATVVNAVPIAPPTPNTRRTLPRMMTVEFSRYPPGKKTVVAPESIAF